MNMIDYEKDPRLLLGFFFYFELYGIRTLRKKCNIHRASDEAVSPGARPRADGEALAGGLTDESEFKTVLPSFCV